MPIKNIAMLLAILSTAPTLAHAENDWDQAFPNELSAPYTTIHNGLGAAEFGGGALIATEGKKILLKSQGKKLFSTLAKDAAAKAAIIGGLGLIIDGTLRSGLALSGRNPGYAPSVSLSRALIKPAPKSVPVAAESGESESSMTAE